MKYHTAPNDAPTTAPITIPRGTVQKYMSFTYASTAKILTMKPIIQTLIWLFVNIGNNKYINVKAINILL